MHSTAMLTRTRKSVSLSIAAATTLMLAGCANMPPSPHASRDSSNIMQEGRAQSHIKRGNITQAVKSYDQLSKQEKNPSKYYEWRLKAAELLMANNFSSQAGARLAELNQLPAPRQLESRRQILNAETKLLEKKPEETLKLLPVPSSSLPFNQQKKILLLRAKAYAAINNPNEQLESLVQLDKLIADKEERRDNHGRIWQLLNQLDNDTLTQLQTRSSSKIYQGWVALAISNRSGQSDYSMRQWSLSHPNHPANQTIAGHIYQPSTQEPLTFDASNIPSAERIALLLPLSGRLANAGRAIKDGFLTAYYSGNNASTRPEVQIIDTRSDPSWISQAYEKALNTGAQMVVGPLHKQSVNQLNDATAIPVTTLTLNYSQSDYSSPNLYQFGLLPEDEARDAARYAVFNNQRNALALLPDNQLGKRLANAFSEEMSQLGGKVTSIKYYKPRSRDMSGPVKELLGINASKQRKTTLQGVLKTQLKFTPQKRVDSDMAFFSGTPQAARLITPQFKFQHASKLPLYATSSIYSGRHTPDSDQDLSGVHFTETPWLTTNLNGPLHQALKTAWPDASPRAARLHALGIDAYALTQTLHQLANNSSYQGQTGKLTLSNTGKIQRSLEWVSFKNGIPSNPIEH